MRFWLPTWYFSGDPNKNIKWEVKTQSFAIIAETLQSVLKHFFFFERANWHYFHVSFSVFRLGYRYVKLSISIFWSIAQFWAIFDPWKRNFVEQKSLQTISLKIDQKKLENFSSIFLERLLSFQKYVLGFPVKTSIST